YNEAQIRAVADVLVDAKYVRNLEITMNTEHAVKLIKTMSEEYGDRLLIGAGTILNMEDLKAATLAGARFVLSPTIMDDEMLKYCHDHKVLAIPGALTPSEIYQMHRKGAYAIKVFPANEMSFGYAKKVIEPLGNINLMAVGGVTCDNVQSYLKGGYTHIASAGGIFKKEDIISQNHDALKASLKQFEEMLETVNS
ncbi:MAG: bifunctional 4-hydroxy-2-oxoglutarate aldolase/2-dehydro-3-deoxy-phosphogluconate aldolase, partial [Erysipelothrix sp.]|nr:bifunctional 4-hydroxy-2-oxoglutarate aldolase/2-dehydro-3-deoxy-phosphogluconate aldolase [Erysipelothrix sp.]